MNEQQNKWADLLSSTRRTMCKAIKDTCYYAMTHPLEKNMRLCLLLFEDSSTKMTKVGYNEVPDEVKMQLAIPIFWVEKDVFFNTDNLNPFDFEDEFDEIYDEDCIAKIRNYMSINEKDALSAVKELNLFSDLRDFEQNRIKDGLVGDLYNETLINWYKKHNGKMLTKRLFSF